MIMANQMHLTRCISTTRHRRQLRYRKRKSATEGTIREGYGTVGCRGICSLTMTRTTQKIQRDRQSGTMDFEECNFRRRATMAIPTYLPTAPYNLIVRAVLIFRASWEFSVAT